MSTPHKTFIQLVKNLCICDDCHEVAKCIFKVVKEIIVRDVNHFHHFKGRLGSCRDYWWYRQIHTSKIHKQAIQDTLATLEWNRVLKVARSKMASVTDTLNQGVINVDSSDSYTSWILVIKSKCSVKLTIHFIF